MNRLARRSAFEAETTMDRRAVLRSIAAGAAAAAVMTACSGQAEPPATAVSLPKFRRSGDVDDSEAFTRAAATGKPIHLPAGGGTGTDGRYRIGTLAPNLLSGTVVFGDGMSKTIIERSYARDTAFVFHADSGSSDLANNLQDIRLSDLTIEDDVEQRGFSQWAYLVMLNGVTGARIERVGFRGFRGDGLYIGSSTVKANERHNRDVAVSHCHFDGVNANNRNAISILDVRGLSIEDCYFENTTRKGGKGAEDPMDPATGPPMPGAIDLEPDSNSFAIIRDVTIRRNRFVGGGGFAVSVSLLPNSFLKTPQSNILVADNIIETRHGGFSASGFSDDAAITDTRAYQLMFSNNLVSKCQKPFIIQGIRGLTVTKNRFVDCDEMGELGYVAANADVSFTDNSFVRVGTKQGYAVWVRTIDRLELTNNKFIDCGLIDGSFGIGVGFVAGHIRNVRFAGNDFKSPLHRTTEMVTIFRDANVSRSTMTVRDNMVSDGISGSMPQS